MQSELHKAGDAIDRNQASLGRDAAPTLEILATLGISAAASGLEAMAMRALGMVERATASEAAILAERQVAREIAGSKLGPSNVGRNAIGDLDFRGLGLVDPSSEKFAKLSAFLQDRYNATVIFDENAASFGRIDELTKTVYLNPNTATWDVFSHEISHIRFSQAMGKWGSGAELTHFELNLMEAIGYYNSYQKAVASGLSPQAAMREVSLGPTYAQCANQAIKSGSPEVQESLQKAVDLYGRDYVEEALRFNGSGISPRKRVLP